MNFLKQLRSEISPFPLLKDIQMNYLKKLQWKKTTEEVLKESANFPSKPRKGHKKWYEDF
jgi:hypothetical protein